MSHISIAKRRIGLGFQLKPPHRVYVGPSTLEDGNNGDIRPSSHRDNMSISFSHTKFEKQFEIKEKKYIMYLSKKRKILLL